MLRFLSFIVVLFALLTPARAQDDMGGGGTGPVTVTAQSQFTRAHPGDKFAIAVRFEFQQGFHIWPNKPYVPPTIPGLAPVATEILCKVPPGVTLLLERTQWPSTQRVLVPAGKPGQEIDSHAEDFTAFVPVVIDPMASPGEVLIPLVAKFQACNDSTCLMTAEVDIPVTIIVVPAAETTMPTDPALFAGFNKTVFDPLPPGAASLGVGGGAVSGLWIILLIAVIGGVLLNFTPCVLPVIPLKIMGLHQQSGSRARTAALGAVMFLGVITFWVVLGALISFGLLRAISDLSSYWQFSFAVGVFMALMGLGMFGVFTVGLPNWVYNVNVGHDTMVGSFLFGIMSAVLATPCVGPLAGGMAAWALTQPPHVGLLVFLAMGVGMGLPYLILALDPKLVAWIPRAGPASELLKHVLGMLMIAFGVLFLGFGILTLVAEYPWISKQIHWWLVYLLIALTALWMAWRTWRITTSPVKRFIFTLLALAVVWIGYKVPRSLTADAQVAYLREQADVARSRGPEGLASARLWAHYDAESVDKDLAAGKVVILEFTAESCLICKVLEANVLYTPDVDHALQADGVRSYKVDLTSRKSPGWERLRALGGSGVPYLVILGPNRKDPWTRNAYTIPEVVKGIEESKLKSSASR